MINNSFMEEKMTLFEQKNLQELYDLLNYVIYQRLSYSGIESDRVSLKVLKKIEEVQHLLERELGINSKN